MVLFMPGLPLVTRSTVLQFRAARNRLLQQHPHCAVASLQQHWQLLSSAEPAATSLLAFERAKCKIMMLVMLPTENQRSKAAFFSLQGSAVYALGGISVGERARRGQGFAGALLVVSVVIPAHAPMFTGTVYLLDVLAWDGQCVDDVPFAQRRELVTCVTSELNTPSWKFGAAWHVPLDRCSAALHAYNVAALREPGLPQGEDHTA